MGPDADWALTKATELHDNLDIFEDGIENVAQALRDARREERARVAELLEEAGMREAARLLRPPTRKRARVPA